MSSSPNPVSTQQVATTQTTQTTQTTPTVPPGSDCCTPPGPGPIGSAEQAQELAGILKALADPTRLRLLSLVAAQGGGEACVCELTEPVGLTQPTVSHHLKVLVDAGLLTREKRGVWAYYALVPERMQQVVRRLDFTR